MNAPKNTQDYPALNDGLLIEQSIIEDEQQFDPREQLEVFWRRRWVVIAVTILFTALGVVYTITRKPIYQAVVKLALITESTKSAPTSTDDILSSLELTSTRNTDTQVEIMKSPDLLDKAFAQIPANSRQKGFESDTIPSWSYSIDAKPDSDVVNITASAYTARLSKLLAQNIAETYLDQDKTNNVRATQTALQYVEKEMANTKAQLTRASEDLARYKRESGLVDAPTQVTQAAQAVYQLRNDVAASRTGRNAAQRSIGIIGNQLRSADPSIPFSSTVQENPAFAQSRSRLNNLRAELNALQEEFTPTSPEVTKKKNEIAVEEKNLATISRNIVTSTSQQHNPLVDKLREEYAMSTADEAVQHEKLKAAEAALAQREKELMSYPERQRRLAELEQWVATIQRTYGMLSDRYYTLAIQVRSTTPYGMIIANARQPQFPAYPNKTQHVAAFFLVGLMLGVAAALLTERLDNRLRDPYLVDRITGLASLTAVPETEPTDTGNGEGRLLLGHVENNHAFLESFRLLRNNIAFSSPDRKMRILAVTSPSKSEGKSTISVNLAIAMAMDGKRVLLIDCDLRRPTIHNWMGVSRDVGLTTVVKGICTMDEAVKQTSYENLWCLPSGPLPPNPTEFLNSQHARQILEQAADVYDVVLIDSPPSTGLSDIQVISTVADGMILVVTLDRTYKQYLMATIRMLRQAGAPLLGTVLNRIKYQRSSYGYYSYYYYYSQYEEEDMPKKKKRHKKKKAPEPAGRS
jgi:capsular exopolysaccharide synthesis family protein